MIFKQAFRWAFITLIWKQYKFSIISTFLLIVFLLIVSNIHQDYLTAIGPENIDRLSFVYKWMAYVIGVLAYVFSHVIFAWLKPSKKAKKVKIESLKKLNNTDKDPFADIRSRKKLRSRSDFLIDENHKE